MDHIYENIDEDEYRTNKKQKRLIVFYGLIADIFGNKNIQLVTNSYLL